MSAETKYLRQLPDTYVRGDYQVPGIGRFVLQSTGSTIFTKTVLVFLHTEGEEESRPGCMRFHCNITDDYQIKWAFGEEWQRLYDRFGDRTPPQYTPSPSNVFSIEEQLAAHGLVERIPQDDPVGFLFHAADRLGMEIQDLHARLRDAKDGIWYLRPRMSADEQVNKFETEHRARLDRLTKMRKACRTWSIDKSYVPDGLYNTLLAVGAGAEPPVLPKSHPGYYTP
jgi:hypothetical protein